MTDFVHLHCHSEYSLLDGMSTPTDIARIASTNGQYAAAITDHGTMGGFLKFQNACESHAVKPIFGVEAYFVPSIIGDGEGKHERFHLILLAKNDDLRNYLKPHRLVGQIIFTINQELTLNFLKT